MCKVFEQCGTGCVQSWASQTPNVYMNQAEDADL